MRRMSICLTWVPNKWFRKTQVIPRFGCILQELGRLWKESAPELMGVKSFLELVRLVQLKKCGNDCIMITKPKLDLGIHLVK